MQLESQQVDELINIAVGAGDCILGVYNSDDFDVEAKGDGSPLTRADRLAHEYIVSRLVNVSTGVPVLSEESADDEMEARRSWATFWLVDPLDGTKEFIKRNGEFTVNIALVVDGEPVFGVVYAPVLGICYAGGPGYGAWQVDAEGSRKDLSVRDYSGGMAIVVASRSHRGQAVDAFIDALQSRESEPEVRSMGSSLKLCLVASGEANVYPRLGPTSEWDTAAAHAVVLGAGGKVTDTHGAPLVYNKESIRNPWFIVSGAEDYPWDEMAPNET